MRGGARRPHARRTLCTLSVRPRAPTKQMGLFQQPADRATSMHLMYFTEQPMSGYPADEGLKFGATALMFSNKHFDPVAGSRLYNEYLEHYRLAAYVSFDGIMLNEHHNAPVFLQDK